MPGKFRRGSARAHDFGRQPRHKFAPELLGMRLLVDGYVATKQTDHRGAIKEPTSPPPMVWESRDPVLFGSSFTFRQHHGETR